MKSFDLREVLAVACAIYRANGNKVVKFNEDKIPASKDVIAAHFIKGETVEVTDADRTSGEEVLNNIQHRSLMMQIANRKQGSFVNNVTQILQADKVPANRLGFVVWAPKIAESIRLEDQQKLDLAQLALTSNYIGTVGDKITVNFTPIRNRFSREYNCYRCFGHDDHGNLVGFLSKKELTGKIVGRVKTQEVSKYNNGAKVTYLNYVKVVK